MDYMQEIGRTAKEASSKVQFLKQTQKNEGLCSVARELRMQTPFLLRENAKDVVRVKGEGMKPAMIDRLLLTDQRINAMADGLEQIAELKDPIGETATMEVRPNGLQIGKRRVPLGVVGIIYESRPNVTADAFGLCFKTGNVAILRGGSDAIRSNKAIIKVIKDGLKKEQLPQDAVLLVENTDRDVATQMMRMNEYIDVLIPRGGKGLIANVVKNSTVPVIETGTGNCHIYVHESADFDKALNIIVNAKTQRVGVCNAAESLLVDRAVADAFLPAVVAVLHDHGVLIHGDEATCAACADAGLVEGDDYVAATEEDWGREYLALEMSVKVVANEDEAIAHINRYGTMHSEAIVAEDEDACERFLDAVDASAVYANASTRFTDGGEFGLGAEIGISTQKLHARGPFAAEALTTYKYKLRGTGQVRP